MPYENEIKRVRRFNLLFMASIGTLLLLMFTLSLGYAIWAGKENRKKLQGISDELINAQAEHKRTTDENKALNQAQVCILYHPATTRTQEQIDNCLKRYRVDPAPYHR